MGENKLPEGWATTPFDDLIIHIIGGDWGNNHTETFSNEFTKAKVIRGTDYKNWNSIRSRNAPVRLLKKVVLKKENYNKEI
ncbi:MAG: hypothetical protein IPK21_21825 [Haliscomenobacter sp.]|nr:hypothetical protein [Haliscomenobacter sp.]